MDHTFKPPSLLSVCTGRRGIEIGIERAIRSFRRLFGDKEWETRDVIQPAVYVEIESVIAYNLVAQMEQGVLAPTPVWTDLKTFPWGLFRNKICILTGGYPCQPFSTAGKQFGVNDPRHLYPYLEYGVDAVKPVCCFFENVSNHINIGYREVRHSLETLGYTVEEGIFSAEEVGAPHLRKRLFILAVADSYCTEQSKRRGDFAKMLGLQEGQRESEHGSSLSGRKSEIMEDSNIKRVGRRQNEDIDRKGRSLQTKRSSDGVGLANSISQRLAQRKKQSAREEFQTIERSCFPSGQGQYQQGWEHPRLESRMGFTVNGYDFTEDLLRLAGNAVVEQQSELAFRTLLNKFI